MSEEKKMIKSGRVLEDVDRHSSSKKNTELLSKNLTELREQYKMSDSTVEDIVMSAERSFEIYQKAYEESLHVIIPPVKPVGQSVLISAILTNIIEAGEQIVAEDFSPELLNSFTHSVSDEQFVVAVGPDCRQVKIGDRVKVRMGDFFRIKNPNTMNSKEVTEIPLVTLDGKNYLEIHERNIRYIYED